MTERPQPPTRPPGGRARTIQVVDVDGRAFDLPATDTGEHPVGTPSDTTGPRHFEGGYQETGDGEPERIRALTRSRPSNPERDGGPPVAGGIPPVAPFSVTAFGEARRAAGGAYRADGPRTPQGRPRPEEARAFGDPRRDVGSLAGPGYGPPPGMAAGARRWSAPEEVLDWQVGEIITDGDPRLAPLAAPAFMPEPVTGPGRTSALPPAPGTDAEPDSQPAAEPAAAPDVTGRTDVETAPEPAAAPGTAGTGRAGARRTPAGAKARMRPARRAHGGSHRRGGKKKRHPIRRAILAVFLVFVVLVGWSLGSALLAPGTDSVAARLAEWARDHGLSTVVTALENWQYDHHPAKVGGTPPAAPNLATGDIRASEPPNLQKVTPPPPVKLFVTPGQPGEGTWSPLEVVNGQPVVQAAYLRSDPVHTSYLSSVVWIDQKYDRFVLHPGSEEPGGGGWSQPDYLPAADRAGLLLTYNGGFKIADAKGGYYEDGKTVGTLVNGAASEIFYKDGSMTVGAWGRDAVMGPDIAGVRQNLQLLVDNGAVNPEVDSDSEAVWGVTVKNADFVWRSGVGVTASGDIVYAAGPALSVRTLAELLARAGAVRAMELDINTDWVSCMSYTPSNDPATVATPSKLLDFSRPADRYYQASSRDFVAVYPR